jgi:hypothetical protein
MTNQVKTQTADHIRDGGLALVQFGNRADFGQYRSKLVLCTVLRMRENESFTAFLVKPVGNPDSLAIAKYNQELYESRITDSDLYVTSACINGNGFEKSFLLGEWDRIKCTKIFSYYF